MLRTKRSKDNSNSTSDIDNYYKFKHYPGASHADFCILVFVGP